MSNIPIVNYSNLKIGSGVIKIGYENQPAYTCTNCAVDEYNIEVIPKPNSNEKATRLEFRDYT